jgi:hypothetical protein
MEVPCAVPIAIIYTCSNGTSEMRLPNNERVPKFLVEKPHEVQSHHKAGPGYNRTK